VGPLVIQRRHFHGSWCQSGDFGADHVLGVVGYVTRGASRMAYLLGVQGSFGKAEIALREVAGWDLDENTIRQLCHATATRATTTRDQRDTAAAFAQVEGDLELQIDAGKVNTLQGWRDVKVAAMTRRRRGKSIAPGRWDQRDLPRPDVRSVTAAVEEATAFGPRCVAEMTRLGLTDSTLLSILGDGAEWIWNLAKTHFDGAMQCLDFWHASEHLADGARAVFGPGEAFESALDRAKRRVLEDGYWGVTQWIGELTGRIAAGGDGAALGGVLNDFASHQERLNYAVRLRRGQSIGSGLIEGSIKQLVNGRLKQTGARWKVEHVAPLVELGALANGPQWDAFWKQK